jgi:hypothetical protein
MVDKDSTPKEKRANNQELSKKVNIIKDPRYLKIYRPDLLNKDKESGKTS